MLAKIEQMIDDKESILLIAQQVNAVKWLLQALNTSLLEKYLIKIHTKKNADPEKAQKIVDEMMKARDIATRK